MMKFIAALRESVVGPIATVQTAQGRAAIRARADIELGRAKWCE